MASNEAGASNEGCFTEVEDDEDDEDDEDMEALDEGEENERREWFCVCVIVFVGSSLGFLFVAVREALGLKM